MPAQTVIKFRRDTEANWTSADPTLAAGEAGFETDTGKLKVGDGSTAWSSLGYISGGASVEVSDTAPASPEANTLWWESDTGTLFIYYDNYWVEAVTGQVGPTGADGADGAAATIAVGTVTDVASGSPATVTNSGTSSAAVFDFEIPAGADGADGTNGADGEAAFSSFLFIGA